MHNKLTKADINKMQEEIEYREVVLRPKILEDVNTARGYGDLSENAEYKIAKQEKNRNESRIRHLKNMIKTAIIIEDNSKDDEVGLSDTVTLYIEEDDVDETYTVVTNIRVDIKGNYISYESPVAKAILGKKEGDRVKVKVSDDYSYYCVIKKIEKGTEDDSRPIRGY
ncbi:MAG: transcription elongation factor GreA [Clostridia bacterium]|nr:transcription elongation factor GreA [Clostridia bacterium]